MLLYLQLIMVGLTFSGGGQVDGIAEQLNINHTQLVIRIQIISRVVYIPIILWQNMLMLIGHTIM